MVEQNTSNNLTRRIPLLVLTCFFLSGLTSLIYQVLWTKMIIKVVGAAPFAIAIVLTVFMAGLGLGSYLASRVIDRVKEPAKLVQIYGVLEFFIGVYAFIIPLLLKVFRPFYSVMYNHLFDYFLLYNILTFIGCFVILCIPVICMGATLPVLCRFYVTRLSHLGAHAGRLYGLNTIGAACGALVSGFWLINLLGIWGTLILAVLINAFIGISCIITGYKTKQQPLPDGEDISPLPPSATVELDQPNIESSFAVKAALLVFAVSGFCAMAYEVIWTRLLGLVAGPTTYSFTIVLVTFITGLALGSIVFGLLADKTKNLLWLLIGTQIATAVSALVVSQLIGNSQLFFSKLIFTFQHSFTKLSLFKAAILFVFLFLPTFFSGATFPLIGKIYTRAVSGIGKSIGFAYTINTIGAVAGSFCAGFLLMPYLGKERGLSLVIGLQLLTVGIIALIAVKNSITKWKPVSLIATSLLGVILCLFFPVWNRDLLAEGKYHRFDAIQEYITDTGWLEILFKPIVPPTIEKRDLVYYGDGIGGFTTVLKTYDAFGNVQYTMVNSGKPDASSRGDMPTQTISAHFPMLFHPNPKTVMVVGLASGITAGEVLNYPIERVDVLDISQQVVQASHFFDPWNNNLLANPKTKLIIQDGRAHLFLTDSRYDVIISEPSNPWMAGLADMFTRDFFAEVHNKLNSEGIFAQWFHSYQMDWQTFALICRTFADVFPNNMLIQNFYPTRGDYLLIGFKDEKKLNLANALSNMQYLNKSKNVKLSDPRLLYRLIMSEDILKLVGSGPVNTDDHPWLEYSAPKVMYSDSTAILRAIESNKILSDKTKSIVNEVASDVNSQIELMEYFLSLNNAVFELVDTAKATPAQNQRFFNLVEGYCAGNPVEFSSLPADDQLRKKCWTLQEETLKSKIDNLPNKAGSYFYLAELYRQGGMIDEAIASASKASVLRPDLATLDLYIANLLASQGKIPEAVEYCLKALKVKAGFLTYRIQAQLGTLLGRQTKYEEAIEYFKKSIRLNPDFAPTHGNFGYVLFINGKIDEAIAELNISIRLDPNEPYSKNSLAMALERKGRFDEAFEYYRDAVRLKPDWVRPMNSLAWMMAVRQTAKFYNSSAAVRLALQTSSLTADSSPDVLNTLAAAYAANGQFPEAVKTAEKALELAKSSQQTQLADNIEKLLTLYKAGRAHIEN